MAQGSNAIPDDVFARLKYPDFDNNIIMIGSHGTTLAACTYQPARSLDQSRPLPSLTTVVMEGAPDQAPTADAGDAVTNVPVCTRKCAYFPLTR